MIVLTTLFNILYYVALVLGTINLFAIGVQLFSRFKTGYQTAKMQRMDAVAQYDYLETLLNKRINLLTFFARFFNKIGLTSIATRFANRVVEIMEVKEIARQAKETLVQLREAYIASAFKSQTPTAIPLKASSLVH